jgi:hypothetical protein
MEVLKGYDGLLSIIISLSPMWKKGMRGSLNFPPFGYH